MSAAMVTPRTAENVPPVGRAPLQRDTIVAVARELIVDRGVEALTLRRLAQRIGVTAPALYAHIRDKEDILRAVVDVELGRLADCFELVEHADPIERIRAHGRAYVEYARDNPELFRVMLLVPPAGTPDSVQLPAATRAFAIAAAAVDDAIASRAIESDDAILVALTLWGGAHGVATVLQLGFDLPSELEDAMIGEITDRILGGYRP